MRPPAAPRRRPDGTRPDGARADGKRAQGKRPDGKRADGKRADGTRTRGQQPAAPRQPVAPPRTPVALPRTPAAPARRETPARRPPGDTGTLTRLRRTLLRPFRREEPAPASGLPARQAERAAAARRLVLHRSAVAAAVVVVLAVLGWVLLVSPLLALEEDGVEITGLTEHVARADVEAAVAPEIGTPLLRVDATAVADRVRQLDAVEDAQVSRAWPHGLTVAILPRVPVAAAQDDGGRWLLLDDDGVQLAVVEEPPAELPQVTVPLEDSGETGRALDAVLTVLGELPPPLLEQVARAGATSPEQVTLILSGGATVRWGSAEDSELKAEVLQVLLQEEAEEYDVSVPHSPTTVG